MTVSVPVVEMAFMISKAESSAVKLVPASFRLLVLAVKVSLPVESLRTAESEPLQIKISHRDFVK